VGKGGEIIIAKAGVPKARLVPIPESHPRQPGKFRDAIEWNSKSFAPLTAEELRDWE
jgi:antitoxin (DNA-binding transcriptional repressor) of toxin-antitoxin stability system